MKMNKHCVKEFKVLASLYDEYVEYIDNYRQYRQAKARNERVLNDIHKLVHLCVASENSKKFVAIDKEGEEIPFFRIPRKNPNDIVVYVCVREDRMCVLDSQEMIALGYISKRDINGRVCWIG